MKSNIKVICKIGKKQGKTTVIIAGVHGNEIPGIKALDRIIPNLKIDSGKVYLIYGNLLAIKNKKRYIEKNLNRCFFKNQPREIKATLEGKTAREIIPYLNVADTVLDLHSSPTKDANPFLICDKKLIKNSNIFDAKIVTYNWDSFEPGSTDNYMNLKKKPGFCFECGYSQSRKSSIIAEKAIYNFLVFTKNIKGKLKTRKKQRILKIKGIYINKKYCFKKVRYCKDFKRFNKKTIIGYEENSPVSVKKEDIILFLKDNKKLNEECFLIAKENLNKQYCSIKLKGDYIK